ncbi:MAG: hypothetical protein ACJ8HJ_03135 [Massilia sp.]|jgi:hypothetical protein
MESWNTAFRRGLVGGATSSVLSTAALALLGRREAGSAYAPTNAVSHWIYGDEALHENAPTLRHTVPGYLIHHGSAMFWSVLLERVCGRLFDRREPALTLGVAAAASAVACFADYQLTPKRFQPGYEAHLSRPSLAVVYGVFGVGLALGAMLSRRS